MQIVFILLRAAVYYHYFSDTRPLLVWCLASKFCASWPPVLQYEDAFPYNNFLRLPLLDREVLWYHCRKSIILRIAENGLSN